MDFNFVTIQFQILSPRKNLSQIFASNYGYNAALDDKGLNEDPFSVPLYIILSTSGSYVVYN